jgi:hypothetical protein
MLTKRQLDNAITKSIPVVSTAEQVAFELVVTSYDRRMVRGYYVTSTGYQCDATFHRNDLTQI